MALTLCFKLSFFTLISCKIYKASMRSVHFTILPASPCAAEFYEIRHTRSSHRCNHCVKFLVNRFRGYGVLASPKLPFPIDLLRRPYNSVALPCDTVTENCTQSMYICISWCSKTVKIKLFKNYKREMYALAHLNLSTASFKCIS